MKNIANQILFHRIPFRLLEGMWKNCSVLELLQILAHKILISDSHKFLKKPSVIYGASYRNQSIDPHCLPVCMWKWICTKRNIWIDYKTITFPHTWEFVIKNDDKSNCYKDTYK